jgi:hypothetical protein
MLSRYQTGNGARSIRNQALISLVLESGLEREEVASLTLDSLNLDQCRLAAVGKGNTDRQMVFGPSLRDLMKEFLLAPFIMSNPSIAHCLVGCLIAMSSWSSNLPNVTTKVKDASASLVMITVTRTPKFRLIENLAMTCGGPVPGRNCRHLGATGDAAGSHRSPASQAPR